jgi:glutamine cyclotransferase
MSRKKQILLIVVAVILVSIIVISLFLSLRGTTPASSSYKYSIVNTFPHDPNAFTEGLLYSGGFLYESTGLYGQSSLRRVDLETGKVLQTYNLSSQYFGEGIALVGNEIIQLTWEEHTAFVYNITSFALLKEFNYSGEGWGLTYDGSRLIMSNGSSILTFLNPTTFQQVGQINVHDENGSVNNLNELEYVQGKVYANIWGQERIAIINIQTGQVENYVDLTGIININIIPFYNVLNGIAYDAKSNKLFVTGKLWPSLFEIKLIPPP